MEPTKLSRLLISEISAVDNPANEIPGHMVLKAAGDGVVGDEESASADAPPSALSKVWERIFAARKDDIDMTAEELSAQLEERDAALIEKFAEVVKSVASGEGAPEASGDEPAPVSDAPEVSAPAEPATEVLPALTADEIVKALQTALQPYNEILENTLNRIERIEASFGLAARKSLPGQESAAGSDNDNPAPTFSDAFKALVEAPVGSSIGSYVRG